MKAFKRGISIVLSILMLVCVMVVMPAAASADTEKAYFVGNITGWQFTEMQPFGQNGGFETTIDSVPANYGDLSFKFTTEANWNNSYGDCETVSYSMIDTANFKAEGVCYYGANPNNITLSQYTDNIMSLRIVFYPDYTDPEKSYVNGRYEIYITTNYVGYNMIRFVNTQGWEDVYCYTYGAETAGAWPGTKLAPIQGTTDQYEFPVGTAGYAIFNNGSDEQTENLTLNGETCNKFYEKSTGAFYDTYEEAEAAYSDYVINRSALSFDAADNVWQGLSKTDKPFQVMGVRKKASGSNDFRFVSVISKEVMDLADDYGYILAKVSTADYSLVKENASYINEQNGSVFSCRTSSNNVSGDYGAAGKSYRYVTASVNGVDDLSTVVARFYVRIGTRYYFAKYTDADWGEYDGCAVSPAYFN